MQQEKGPSPEELKRRKDWFEWYTETLEKKSVRKGPLKEGCYACPCCGSLTLTERGGFEICDVCFWEDDGQDDADADTVRGGPNGSLSLTQARANFKKFGACKKQDRRFVRIPFPKDELGA